jgi:hypothetical protein
MAGAQNRPTTIWLTLLTVVTTSTARGQKQNYQQGRLSIFALYLQAVNQDFFSALSNIT